MILAHSAKMSMLYVYSINTPIWESLMLIIVSISLHDHSRNVMS